MTQYEFVMSNLAGVASAMLLGWVLSKDPMGLFLGGLGGTILTPIAFYPEISDSINGGSLG